MDFLGLRTLTVIQDAVQLGRQRVPAKRLTSMQIDYNDKKVLDYYRKRRKTDGIFQLESGGYERVS